MLDVKQVAADMDDVSSEKLLSVRLGFMFFWYWKISAYCS